MKRSLAEALGSFALVFAGTGAIVVDRITGGGAVALAAVGACRCVREPGCCGSAPDPQVDA